jgi:protein-disulfide isomerase
VNLEGISAPAAVTAESNRQAGVDAGAGSTTAAPAQERVGFTAEGYPYRGDPDAPITLEEYSDYLCPFCWRHFHHTLPALLEKYVATGRLKLVYRDFPLVALHATAPRGSEAALCVGEQGAALFWDMHDALFRTQRDWNRLSDPTDFLASLAEDIAAHMPDYQACMASRRKQPVVEQSVAAGKALGFDGTPSFRFIDEARGVTHHLVGALPLATFDQWMAALAAGEEPPSSEPEQAKAPELPFWAKTEGLAPDPDRPGTTLAGDQFKGDPAAPVVVVEFADFQCPACRRHALETQPRLDEAFVDTGQVRWVFKHLPRKNHARALMGAAAAECAADQGRFWPMHDLLFEGSERWSAEDADGEAALHTLDDDLGLDEAAFAACLDSRVPLERVLGDLYDAQGVVKTIPTFVVLYGGKGHVLTGSRSADHFAAALRSRVETAAKLSAANADE